MKMQTARGKYIAIAVANKSVSSNILYVHGVHEAWKTKHRITSHPQPPPIAYVLSSVRRSVYSASRGIVRQ